MESKTEMGSGSPKLMCESSTHTPATRHRPSHLSLPNLCISCTGTAKTDDQASACRQIAMLGVSASGKKAVTLLLEPLASSACRGCHRYDTVWAQQRVKRRKQNAHPTAVRHGSRAACTHWASASANALVKADYGRDRFFTRRRPLRQRPLRLHSSLEYGRVTIPSVAPHVQEDL